MSETVEAIAELDAASELVYQSRSQFFVPNLRRWFRALEGYPPFARIVLQQLNAEIEFHAWYKRCTETMESMVGSGKLIWPSEPHNVIALQLALFRRFEREDIAPLDFCSCFLFSIDGDDAMVRDIVEQLFRPLVIDLRRFLQRALENAPAPPTLLVAPPALQSVDRARFIEMAPLYYALAVVDHLERNRFPTTKSEIILDFAYPDNVYPDDLRYRLVDCRLLDAALKILAEDEEIIVLEFDDFGPPVITPVAHFPEGWMVNSPDLLAIFQRYGTLGDGGKKRWLNDALDRVEKERVRLEIQDSDFDEPNYEWEPIPLDRSEPELQTAIRAVDEIVESVRSDNGYAANLPEERAFVLDGLTVFATRLKTSETISVPFIRTYGIDNMNRLIIRFGPAAVGVVAGSALEGLKAWLKAKTGGALDWLFK